MTLTTDFDLNQQVIIIPIDKIGIIRSIFVGETGVQFSVRYFNGEVPQEVYCYKNEISKLEEKESIGFKTKL